MDGRGPLSCGITISTIVQIRVIALNMSKPVFQDHLPAYSRASPTVVSTAKLIATASVQPEICSLNPNTRNRAIPGTRMVNQRVNTIRIVGGNFRKAARRTAAVDRIKTIGQPQRFQFIFCPRSRFRTIVHPGWNKLNGWRGLATAGFQIL